MDEGIPASPDSSSRSERFVCFDQYQFDRVGGFLSRDGIEVALPPRAARLLACLLEDPGKVVPKDALIAAVWNGVAVSDQSLAEAISQLRHALKDDPTAPTYVQTVHRRGYRFVATVTVDQHDLQLHAGDGLTVVGPPLDPAPASPTWASAAARRPGGRLLLCLAIAAAVVVVGTLVVRAWLVRNQLAEQQRALAELDDQMRTVVPQQVGSAFGTNPTVEFVWEQASINSYGASPSPDGEYIAYGGSGSAPSLYSIDTGETASMVKEENTPEDWVATAPVFSPDGRRVAYLFGDEMGVEEPELRIVGTDNGEWATLLRGTIATPIAWDPDGRHLVAHRQSRSGLEIVRISVEDGSSTTLHTFSGRSPGKLSLSPNGLLAYDVDQDDGSGRRDIYLISLDDGVELPVVEHPMNDLLPMWTPDGSGILFVSNRSGSYALWVVSVVDGDVRGPAPLIQPGADPMIWPLGLTGDGTLFYGVGSGAPAGSELHVAALEPNASAAAQGRIEALSALPGLNLGPTWSPDGNRLAYLSQRGLLFQPDTVIVISLMNGIDGRVVSQIQPWLRYVRNPRWSPDAQSILVRGYDAAWVWGFYLIDVATSDVTPLLQMDSPGPSRLSAAQWLPDGSGIVYGRIYREPRVDPATGETRNARVQTLSLRRLDDDEDRELHRVIEPLAREGWALSPDGRDLAVSLFLPEGDSYRVALQLIPVAGGPPEEVFSVSSPFTIASLAWAPDGERILFVRKKGALWEERRIWSVSLETGEAEPLGFSLPGIREIALDPSGSRVAFVASTKEPSTHVLALRDFLPTLPAMGDRAGLFSR